MILPPPRLIFQAASVGVLGALLAAVAAIWATGLLVVVLALGFAAMELLVDAAAVWLRRQSWDWG